MGMQVNTNIAANNSDRNLATSQPLNNAERTV